MRRFALPCPGYRHGTPKAGALPTALHPDIQFLTLYHGKRENQRFFVCGQPWGQTRSCVFVYYTRGDPKKQSQCGSHFRASFIPGSCRSPASAGDRPLLSLRQQYPLPHCLRSWALLSWEAEASPPPLSRYSRVIFSASSRSRISWGQMAHWTSPIWAFSSSSIQILLCPMPPPMVRGYLPSAMLL